MKYIITFFLVLFTFFLKSQTKWVKLSFEETSSYCGGAVPTPEVLEALKQKKPFAHKTLYIYTKGKCVDSVKTDSSGVIHKKMKLGKYDLYLPWKHFKTAPVGTLSEYNPECMKKEWLIADGILEVTAKNVAFSNKRIGQQICFYEYNCLIHRYLPPAAPPKQN